MAKQLNQATTDKIVVANPYTIGSGSEFTYVQWCRQRGAPGNSEGTGKIGAGSELLEFLAFFTNWFCQVLRATVTANAFVTDANLFPIANVWVFYATTYSESDGLRIYRGTIDTPAAEMSYFSRVVGAGATSTIANELVIGNRNLTVALAPRHDIEHVSLWDKIITLAQMNRLRVFPYAPMHRFSVGGTVVNLKSYHPLTESAAATARDHSGNGNHGTVTGTTLITIKSPFSLVNRGVRQVVVTPAAATDDIGAQYALLGVSGRQTYEPGPIRSR